MRIFIAALLIPLSLVLATAANAQGAGMGGGHKRGQQSSDKSASQAPKADDKAYKDALKTVPNKPYDPWQNTR
jgi:hypothetical protein